MIVDNSKVFISLQIVWSRDGEMISVINSDTKSVLEKLKVSQTGADQFGNYSCFANNSMGSVSAVVSYSGNVIYNVSFNLAVTIG